MSERVKVKLDRGGVRELLKSSEMEEAIGSYAAEAVARAGDGYEFNTHSGQNRVNARIYASTSAAVHDNLKNNTLLKVLR